MAADKEQKKASHVIHSGLDFSHQIRAGSRHADAEDQVPTSLPIRTVRCPHCEHNFEENCEGLEADTTCPSCKKNFPYVDGYLNYYKEYIEVFIDEVHALPLVPGFSTSGQVMSLPDDLLIVDFGISYRKPPELFFLVPGNRSARQWIADNQVLLPISIGEDNFILFSRTLDRSSKSKPTPVTWVALGETGEWEKPLWLNYLQNAARLVREGEDVAAIVMLMIALDFFYDTILERIGITFEMIRREGRRPGMNEKRAKLKMISDKLGEWPEGFTQELTDLTDYRNHIVHGVIKKDTVRTYTGRRAFQIVMRATLFLIEMLYHPRPVLPPEEDQE